MIYLVNRCKKQKEKISENPTSQGGIEELYAIRSVFTALTESVRCIK